MPINPEIPLQGKPVQFDSPGLVNMMQQGQALRMQQDQQRMQQEQLGMQRESHNMQMQTGALALQEHQRLITEGQQYRDLFKPTAGPDGQMKAPDLRAVLPKVYAINPVLGESLRKSLYEQDKGDLELLKTKTETQAKQAERYGAIAGTITDEPSYHRGIITALNEGLLKPADAQALLAEGWDKQSQAYVQQIVKGAMGAKEQHDVSLADIKAKQDALASQHESELHPYKLEKAQTEASMAYRESDATALAAAAKQGPDALGFALRRLSETSPDRIEPFASINWKSTPEDILRIAMKPEQVQRADAEVIDRAYTERHRRAVEARLDKLNTAGLSQVQNQRVTQIANQFDGEAIVKNYNVITEGLSFAESLGTGSKANAGDDQALLYSFAKVMDPNSVVREGEYATVQKYSQSWAQQFGFKAERIFMNSPFLTDEARKQLKATMQKKGAAAKTNYENVYNEYGRRIEKQAGVPNGKEFLTNYGQAFQQPAGGGHVIEVGGKHYAYKGSGATDDLNNYTEVKQ